VKHISKFAIVMAAVVLAAFAVSCASTKPKPAPSPAPVLKPTATKVVIEHKNTMLGGEVPEWVTMEIGDIEATPKYKDSYVFRGEAVGGSEAGAKLLATQMDVDTQIARMINLRVQNLFSGAQVGDDKNLENYMENIVKSLADAKISGWRNMANFWVQYEYTATKKQEFRYFVLFTIPKETVKALLADALQKQPPADTKEKLTARDKVRQLIDSNLPALSGAQQEGTTLGK
jgi:hypothetical protein